MFFFLSNHTKGLHYPTLNFNEIANVEGLVKKSVIEQWCHSKMQKRCLRQPTKLRHSNSDKKKKIKTEPVVTLSHQIWGTTVQEVFFIYLFYLFFWESIGGDFSYHLCNRLMILSKDQQHHCSYFYNLRVSGNEVYWLFSKIDQTIRDTIH